MSANDNNREDNGSRVRLGGPIMFNVPVFVGRPKPKEISLATLQLETQAKQLEDPEKRNSLKSQPKLFTDLRPLWEFVTLPESLEEISNGSSELNLLALALLRFCRNAVAEVEENQSKMLSNERYINILLTHLTAYEPLQKRELFLVTRIAIQTVSNLLTANVEVSTTLWKQYLTISAEKNFLCRIMATPDIKTQLGVLILVINALHAYPQGIAQMFEGYGTSNSVPPGVVLCEAVLKLVDTWFDVKDGDPERSQKVECFDAAYELFSLIFEARQAQACFNSLGHPTEPLTPPQLTFLKFLDAYIHSLPNSAPPPLGISFLIPLSLRLICHVSNSLSSIPSSGLPSQAAPNEVRFEKVYSAIVVVLQGLVWWAIKEREMIEKAGKKALLKSPVVEGLKKETTTDSKGLVEMAIILLRQIDTILPRLQRLSKTPSASITPISESTPIEEQNELYATVRRDLVRIIGVMAYEDEDVQDRVRECGGLDMILSLCAMDDQNPYLREHALFTVRILLMHNMKNQAAVKELQPMGVFDQDGVLQDMPERWKNSKK